MMASVRIRQIEVLIGPFVDTENTDTTTAEKIVTTGDSRDLSVSFSVTKTAESTLNQAEIVIENLNRETETKFNQENLAIELRAGWIDSESGIQTIHKGGVKIVNPSGNFTRIATADGAGASLFAVTNRSYSGKDNLEQVIRDLVGDMENITIGRLSVSGELGFKGRQFSGKTVDQLNNLAHQFGFTWSIQDGVFQAFDDDGSTDKTYTFNDNNITDIRPLKGVVGQDEGFSMDTYLDGRVNAGDKIQVDSKARPQYSGTYLVTKHVMTGASHGDDWGSGFEMVRV